jgi:hypothetical protein
MKGGQRLILTIRWINDKLKSTLEVVSKPQIRFKGKAQAERESAATMGL